MSIPYNQGSLFEESDGELVEIPLWQNIGKTLYRSLNAPLPLQNPNELYPGQPLLTSYAPSGENIPHPDPAGIFATKMEDFRNTQMSDQVQEEYAKFMAGTAEYHYPTTPDVEHIVLDSPAITSFTTIDLNGDEKKEGFTDTSSSNDDITSGFLGFTWATIAVILGIVIFLFLMVVIIILVAK